MGILAMADSRKRTILAAGAACLFALGLAACGEGGPEQQSSNPVESESSDAAATPQSGVPESTTGTTAQ